MNGCWTEWRLLLERWAPSAEDCPVNPLRLEFDSECLSDRGRKSPCRKDCCVWRLSSAVLMTISSNTIPSPCMSSTSELPASASPRATSASAPAPFRPSGQRNRHQRVAAWRIRAAGRALQLENRRAPQRPRPRDGRKSATSTHCIASGTIEQLRVKSLNAKLLWLSVFLKPKSILERSCQQA